MKNILLVDDNADLRYSVIQGMKGLTSYNFLEAESGEKALKVLEVKDVDLILLDIMMPEMDGWDVVSELKKNTKTKDIPVVFLTAKTDSLSKGMGKLNSEDYVEKPVDYIDLKERIERIIGQ